MPERRAEPADAAGSEREEVELAVPGDVLSRHRLTPQPEDDDPRLAILIAAVEERLRPICADWDDASFQEMVLGIARRKLRWRIRDRQEESRPD